MISNTNRICWWSPRNSRDFWTKCSLVLWEGWVSILAQTGDVGGTVQWGKTGFCNLTLPACGLLPSFSPVTHSLAPILVYCQPPFPIASLKSGPESCNSPTGFGGKKVGHTPTHPFLSPTTNWTLHTAAPLFSVQADCGKQCDQRP